MKASVRIELRPMALLTIGGQGYPVGPDIVFSRLGIHGSSLKGAAKTAVGMMILSGIVKGYTFCGEVEPGRIHEAHRNGVCDVCSLFGYPERVGDGWRPGESRGRVDFRTVRFDAVKDHLYQVTRTSIDPSTGRVLENALYTTESAVPPGPIQVEATVDARSCRDLELFLLSLHGLRLNRLGRAGSVDLRISDASEVEELAKRMGCSVEGLLGPLLSYLWGDLG